MPKNRAKYSVGDIVRHKLFDYRGVIFDVDATFLASDEWYDAMARSRPPKDEPWYHVLVHQGSHTTYVAERNLEPDTRGEPIRHPELDKLFGEFVDGRYQLRQSVN